MIHTTGPNTRTTSTRTQTILSMWKIQDQYDKCFIKKLNFSYLVSRAPWYLGKNSPCQDCRLTECENTSHYYALDEQIKRWMIDRAVTSQRVVPAVFTLFSTWMIFCIMLTVLHFNLTCLWIFLENSTSLPSCLWIPLPQVFFILKIVFKRHFHFSSLVFLYQFYSFVLWYNFSEFLLSGTWACMQANMFIQGCYFFYFHHN